MKPGKYAIGMAMLVLFLGIAAYFGIYIYKGLSNVMEFAEVYTATEDDRAEVSGFLVREESVIDESPGTLLEVVLSEGEKVSAGGTVAKVYSSEDAVDRQQQIEELEAELTRLQSLQAGTSTSDAVTLDNEITELTLAIHKSSADSSFSTLSDDAADLKNTVFRRIYLYSEDASLDTDISSLGTQIAVLESASEADTRRITAPVSGTYSGYVDGYESLLTIDSLSNVTVSDIQSWEDLDATVDREYIGKLITNPVWYFAAIMNEEDAEGMGSTVTLRFTSDFTTPITMEVESVSKASGGKVAVVLSSRDYLTQTTQLRYQAADVVYSSCTGLEVPLSAVRMVEKEQFDGTVVEETGVYVVVGKQAEWKPVNVIYSNSEVALVEPTDEGDADALRSGDIVISKGKNIFDGKVIEQ